MACFDSLYLTISGLSPASQISCRRCTSGCVIERSVVTSVKKLELVTLEVLSPEVLLWIRNEARKFYVMVARTKKVKIMLWAHMLALSMPSLNSFYPTLNKTYYENYIASEALCYFFENVLLSN